jgi:molybdate-binding protein/DNA-binding XRE family transcriptional regulator
MGNLETSLREKRQQAGLTQEELADRVKLSRQALNSIEKGHAAPSTQVALQLARALRCRLEELFWLPAAGGEVVAVAASPEAQKKGARVALASTEGAWVAHALPPGDAGSLSMAADGIVAARDAGGRARVSLLAEEPRENLILSGCDPALGLLAARVARAGGARPLWLPFSSDGALRELAAGHAHLAGAHLFDEESGEYNVPFVRRAFAGKPMLVITLAHIEEGFASRKGERIRRVEDLAQKGLRLVNREAGAAARKLLDRVLRKAGMPSGRLRGYGDLARGHLDVAQRIATGGADVGVVARSAAVAFDLEFTPLARERFDLVLPKPLASDPRVLRLLETLEGSAFRRELQSLGGYEPAAAGRVVAELAA